MGKAVRVDEGREMKQSISGYQSAGRLTAGGRISGRRTSVHQSIRQMRDERRQTRDERSGHGELFEGEGNVW